MNFRNFYILTFNKTIKSKSFTFIFIGLNIFILIISLILNRLDFNITDNDIIRHYQIHKINSDNFKTINTIIVGDSSGGNSINSEYFNELSGLKSENLCLTGSWGIIGSLGIMQKALKKNPDIKNIIIVQTLDIWKREYSKESILELFDANEIYNTLDSTSIMGFLFNPKEIWWHIEHIFNVLLNNDTLKKIDENNHYLVQKEKKYSNKKLVVKNETHLNFVQLSSSKQNELQMLEKYCQSNSLNCIFLNGPIHEDIIKNSTEFIHYLHTNIQPQFSFIKYYPNIFSYADYKMGDSTDHMDVEYKKESTINYFKLIKDDLILTQ